LQQAQQQLVCVHIASQPVPSGLIRLEGGSLARLADNASCMALTVSTATHSLAHLIEEQWGISAGTQSTAETSSLQQCQQKTSGQPNNYQLGVKATGHERC
jgi:hypothetical protein